MKKTHQFAIFFLLSGALLIILFGVQVGFAQNSLGEDSKEFGRKIDLAFTSTPAPQEADPTEQTLAVQLKDLKKDLGQIIPDRSGGIQLSFEQAIRVGGDVDSLNGR